MLNIKHFSEVFKKQSQTFSKFTKKQIHKVLSFSMKFLSDLQEIFTSLFLAFGFCYSDESISQKFANFWLKFKKSLFETLLGGKNSYKIISRFEILASYGRINIETRKRFCSSYCLIFFKFVIFLNGLVAFKRKQIIHLREG